MRSDHADICALPVVASRRRFPCHWGYMLDVEDYKFFPARRLWFDLPRSSDNCSQKISRKVTKESTVDTVRIEKTGPVTTVILSRPDVRNAVDRPTATALEDSFAAFEHDETAMVAVFSGDNGRSEENTTEHQSQ